MAKTPKRPKKQPTGDYPSGYCRPPEHTRTKHGEVRNPFGRNGKPKKELDAFDKVRTRLSRVTIDGEVLMVRSDEAFYLLQWSRSMANDKTASKIIASEMAARRRLAPPGPDPHEQAADEKRRRELSAILVNLLEDLMKAKNGGPVIVNEHGRLVPYIAPEPLQPDPNVDPS